MIDKFLAWLNPAPAPEPTVQMQALPIYVGVPSPQARRDAARLARLYSVAVQNEETFAEINLYRNKLQEQGFVAPKSAKECDILIDNL